MSYKDFLKSIKPKRLVKLLNSLYTDDCYYTTFLKSEFYDNILHCLEYYGIAFIASDGRVLLTSFGRTLLFELSSKVLEES